MKNLMIIGTLVILGALVCLTGCDTPVDPGKKAPDPYEGYDIVGSWEIQDGYGMVGSTDAYYYFYADGTGKFGYSSIGYMAFTYSLPSANQLTINNKHFGFLEVYTYNYSIVSQTPYPVLTISNGGSLQALKKSEY